MTDYVKNIKDALARLVELEERSDKGFDPGPRIYNDALIDFAVATHREAISAMLGELEAAKKDAERYRWLRSEHSRHDTVCHLSWKLNDDRNGSAWVNTAELDAAIDAAIKGATP